MNHSFPKAFFINVQCYHWKHSTAAPVPPRPQFLSLPCCLFFHQPPDVDIRQSSIATLMKSSTLLVSTIFYMFHTDIYAQTQTLFWTILQWKMLDNLRVRRIQQVQNQSPCLISLVKSSFFLKPITLLQWLVLRFYSLGLSLTCSSLSTTACNLSTYLIYLFIIQIS